MSRSEQRLRIALVTGSLARGGAEKQLVYLARALCASGVDVRVYSLTQGEYFEQELRSSGLSTVFVGRRSNPVFRLARLAVELRAFRPHVVQACQWFTSPYVQLAATACRAVGISSIRSDVVHNLAEMGRAERMLFRYLRTFVVNSVAAKQNAIAMGMNPAAIHVLSNVIDLHDFDARSRLQPAGLTTSGPCAAIVGRLVSNKRIDRFLRALSFARQQVPNLSGVVIGAGSLLCELHRQARDLGLDAGAVQFLGAREDVPALLSQVDMLLMTSEHEGFPNVLLEAMAARLPVISSPAGDAARIVEDGVTGYIVDADNGQELAARVVQLARSPSMGRRLGSAGRAKVESEYRWETLAARATGLYREIAERLKHTRTLTALTRQSQRIEANSADSAGPTTHCVSTNVVREQPIRSLTPCND